VTAFSGCQNMELSKPALLLAASLPQGDHCSASDAFWSCPARKVTARVW
jgi:hypothetical protein